MDPRIFYFLFPPLEKTKIVTESISGRKKMKITCQLPEQEYCFFEFSRCRFLYASRTVYQRVTGKMVGAATIWITYVVLYPAVSYCRLGSSIWREKKAYYNMGFDRFVIFIRWIMGIWWIVLRSNLFWVWFLLKGICMKYARLSIESIEVFL